jgi:hypothetical protein
MAMSQMGIAERLRMWGQENDSPPPDWQWVEDQLRQAGTYWVVARSAGHPHPRPVWGIWRDGALLLSIGSPPITRDLAADPRITVHLESGTEVVIVEGLASVVTEFDALAEFTAAYNAKYDWEYRAERDGPPTRVDAHKVLTWRAAGTAGRDGFPQAARWTFQVSGT